MKVVNAIAEILKREGVEYLFCFPSNPIIDAAAEAGIRPIMCRQERIGVTMAAGYSRVSNGKRIGVFSCMQGPGAECAFGGTASAYADQVPILLLLAGNERDRGQVFPMFSAIRSYHHVMKWAEELTVANQVSEVMRRAFNQLKMGSTGPVMVEVPRDVFGEEIDYSLILAHKPVKPTFSPGNPDDVKTAAEVLANAQNPLIIAGQGVLYAEASEELVELADFLQAPVTTTFEGISAFPQDHPLSLGNAAGERGCMTGPAHVFLSKADVIFGIGTSLTKYMASLTDIPPGKVIIQSTNCERDLNKNYATDYPIIGDAKLVLKQFIEAVKVCSKGKGRQGGESAKKEVNKAREEWLRKWMPKLTSNEVPINPYRIYWELMQTVDPREAIVANDAGDNRAMLTPFYLAKSPHDFVADGKSHPLGASLGIIMGAKMAAPGKFCVNFMGDGAFGQTGTDFMTAVQMKIPITTIVLNNGMMRDTSRFARTARKIGLLSYAGNNYAEVGRALGGYAERIENPGDVASAIRRARKANQEGQPALLEAIVSKEPLYCSGMEIVGYDYIPD